MTSYAVIGLAISFVSGWKNYMETKGKLYRYFLKLNTYLLLILKPFFIEREKMGKRFSPMSTGKFSLIEHNIISNLSLIQIGLG